jgi:hypothetical protein
MWCSKKQDTVETSTFGSEFVALKIATKILWRLRYKLQKMGIPIAGSSYVYFNNNSVVVNSSGPALIIKKKSNSIAYHAVRWSVAADEQRFTHISSENNVSDLMTKPLPGGAKWDSLVGLVLHDIVNEVMPMVWDARDSSLMRFPLVTLMPKYAA